MKANYVGFGDGAESMAYLDQERGVIIGWNYSIQTGEQIL